MIFIISGCTKELTGDEKTAADYVKAKGYKILSYKGEIDKYTLDKSLFLYENDPIGYYRVTWGVQTVEPDNYLEKQITVYNFIVKGHPLEERFDNKYKTTSLSIIMCDGKVIGGFSYPDQEKLSPEEHLLGGPYSLEGKTLEEVTELSYSKWREIWDDKYGD